MTLLKDPLRFMGRGPEARDIEDGKEDFASLEEKAYWTRHKAELRAATHSDHLEQIKDTINHYIIQTLAK